MNVLSLFDGISCGMLALRRAGVRVDRYYASEINDKAISVSERHFPEIVRLGDVNQVSYEEGVLSWDGGKERVEIDLMIGGSPCQNLSNIGNKKGIRGDKSILALQYFRIMKQVGPKYFLLENVLMGENDEKIFTASMNGISPVFINSAVFGAQIRKRNYWTNISVPELPKENSPMMVRDILDDQVSDPSRTYMSDSETFVEFLGRIGVSELRTEHGKEVDPTCEKDTTRANRYRLEHVRAMSQKCRCLSTQCGNMASTSGCGVYIDGKLRGLTPTEVERLQDLPPGYTDILAKTYRYQAVGDGWHVGTIAHIFSGLKSAKRAKKVPVVGDVGLLMMLSRSLKENKMEDCFDDAASLTIVLRKMRSEKRERMLEIVMDLLGGVEFEDE